jgi:hypothetical protein
MVWRLCCYIHVHNLAKTLNSSVVSPSALPICNHWCGLTGAGVASPQHTNVDETGIGVDVMMMATLDMFWVRG